MKGERKEDGSKEVCDEEGESKGLCKGHEEVKEDNVDSGELVVWDLFSGCGGNAIPLALTFPRVVAVDIDGDKLPHLLHNAAIYGVETTRLEVLCADAYDVLKGEVVPVSGGHAGITTINYQQRITIVLPVLYPS